MATREQVLAEIARRKAASQPPAMATREDVLAEIARRKRGTNGVDRNHDTNGVGDLGGADSRQTGEDGEPGSDMDGTHSSGTGIRVAGGNGNGPVSNAVRGGGGLDIRADGISTKQSTDHSSIGNSAPDSGTGLDPNRPAEGDFFGSSIIEPALTMVSGAIAEPVAGIAALSDTLNPFTDNDASETVADIRGSLTYKPRTKSGREAMESIGSALEPIASALESTEKFLGDETFAATGSPALAAAAKTLPTAMLEILGVAGAKGVVKPGKGIVRSRSEALKAGRIKKSIVESAPDIKQLKDTARAVYKEIDDAGVTVAPKAYQGLVSNMDKVVKKAGFDADLTPKSAAVMKRLESELGKSLTLSEVDTLRKVAGNAAKSIEPADAAIGSIMIDVMDQFLDSTSPNAFRIGNKAATDVAPKFKVARELWGRARRSEVINEAFEKARLQASGFENGIVTQFRSILNNRKKARFFKSGEVEAMRKVVKGSRPGNIAKFIGKFGFSEGHATSMLGSSVGAGAGIALTGSALGGLIVPVIGQVAKKISRKTTIGHAEFADAIVRAGSDAGSIAATYMDNIKSGARSSADLSEFLLRPDIPLDGIINSGNKIISEAGEIARGKRVLATFSAPAAVKSTQQEDK